MVTVIMAVYGRRHLVEINLRLLTEQKCDIVVATSLQEDFDFIRSLKLQNVQIVPAPNNPLGKKWQIAVDAARILGAGPLITLGSDDFLSQNFIKRACELSLFHDFIALTQWHVYSPEDRKMYSLRYKMMFPLGGGRVYSRAFLDKKDWKLFDVTKDRLLDDFAWDNVGHDDNVLFNPDDMAILSIKGRHEVMNPLDKILSSDSIAWKEVGELDSLFGFSKPIKEIF